MNNKGISAVVTAIIMIVLVMAAILLVWGFVRTIIDENLEDAASCSNLFNKVEINDLYTCYDTDTKNLSISIAVKDFELKELVMGVSQGGESVSYIITDELKSVSGLRNFQGGPEVQLPGENGAKVYIIPNYPGFPDQIIIHPVVGGSQCEATDQTFEIDDCRLLT